MSLQSILGIAVLAGVACSCPSPSAPARAETPPVAAPAAHSQVQAKWVAHDPQPGKVSLTAHIEVFAPFAAPMQVKITVPDGASIDGPTEFELPAPRFATTIDRELTVSYAAIPEKDLVLTVDVRAPHYGMHAEDVYRFGRPAPVAVLPKATGPHLKVGTVDLGRSVPLQTK